MVMRLLPIVLTYLALMNACTPVSSAVTPPGPPDTPVAPIADEAEQVDEAARAILEPAAPSAGALPIGVNLELSSPMRDAGQATLAGLRAAEELYEAQRELDLELLVCDNAGEAAGASACAEALAAAGALVVLGPALPIPGFDAATLASRLDVPHVSLGSDDSGAPALGEHVFLARASRRQTSEALARYLTHELGLRRAAIVHAWSEDRDRAQADAFALAFEAAGGEAVAFRYTRSLGPAAAVDAVADFAPDAVFVVGPCDVNAPFLQGLAAFLPGVQRAVTDPEWCAALPADLLDGVHFTSAIPPVLPATPLAAELAQRVDVQDDVPVVAADAFFLVARALERADVPTREGLRAALQCLEVVSVPSGEVGFAGSGGQPRGYPIALYRFVASGGGSIADREFVEVLTSDHLTDP